jgi:hypothetical protein
MQKCRRHHFVIAVVPGPWVHPEITFEARRTGASARISRSVVLTTDLTLA